MLRSSGRTYLLDQTHAQCPRPVFANYEHKCERRDNVEHPNREYHIPELEPSTYERRQTHCHCLGARTADDSRYREIVVSLKKCEDGTHEDAWEHERNYDSHECRECRGSVNLRG